MLNEGKTLKRMIQARPAKMGRFAAALKVADEAVIWASPDGDGVTWNVMFAKSTAKARSTPVFIVQVWESGDQVVVISEPTEVGTLGDFTDLITLLDHVRGGNGRVH